MVTLFISGNLLCIHSDFTQWFFYRKTSCKRLVKYEMYRYKYLPSVFSLYQKSLIVSKVRMNKDVKNMAHTHPSCFRSSSAKCAKSCQILLNVWKFKQILRVCVRMGMGMSDFKLYSINLVVGAYNYKECWMFTMSIADLIFFFL